MQVYDKKQLFYYKIIFSKKGKRDYIDFSDLVLYTTKGYIMKIDVITFKRKKGAISWKS